MGGHFGGFWLVVLGLDSVLVLGFCFGLALGFLWPGLGFGLGLGLGLGFVWSGLGLFWAWYWVWSWSCLGSGLESSFGSGLGRFRSLVLGGPQWALLGFFGL